MTGQVTFGSFGIIGRLQVGPSSYKQGSILNFIYRGHSTPGQKNRSFPCHPTSKRSARGPPFFESSSSHSTFWWYTNMTYGSIHGPKIVGFPNKPMGFPTKNDQHLGCEMEVAPFKETPIWNIYLHLPYESTKCKQIYQSHGSSGWGYIPMTSWPLLSSSFQQFWESWRILLDLFFIDLGWVVNQPGRKSWFVDFPH